MAPKAIGNLGAVPSQAAGVPSGLTEFFQGIGQMPQTMAAQQASIAQNQATIATDQEQQDELAQKALERWAQAGISNPAATSNPQYVNVGKTLAAHLKIPLAMNPDGSVNPQGMLPKRELTEQEQEAAQLLSPADRQARFGNRPDLILPPGFLEEAQQFTPAEKDRVLTDVANAFNKIADPHGGGIESLMAIAGTPVAKSVFPDLQSLISTPQFQAAIQQRVDLSVQDMESKGILKLQDEQTYRTKYLANLEKKTQDQYDIAQMNEADRRAALQLQARREALAEQKAAAQVTQWEATNKYRMDALDQADRHFTAAQTFKGAGAQQLVFKQAGVLNQALNGAQSAYDSLVRTAATYTAQGQDPPKEMSDRITALQTRIQGLQAQADLVLGQVQNAQTSAVRTTTGASRAVPVGGQQAPLGPPVATDRNGRSVYSPSPGSYVYADGTPYQP